jgi:hypothetical protein
MLFEARLIAADDDEIVDVGDSAQPLMNWSGVALPGFDSVRLATLHALMTGEPFQLVMDQYEPIYVSAEEVCVFRMPEELLEALVELDDEAMGAVAEELAKTEEFEADEWTEENVLDLLAAVVSLAQLADDQDQSLLLVIRPLEMTEE